MLLDDGRVLQYDELVLATGSAPFVPPVPGHDAARLLRLPHHRRPGGDPRGARPARPSAPSSAAACSASRPPTRCAQLGLETHVVEIAPRLMPVQVDDAGGATLRRHIEDLGLHVHTGADDHRGRRARRAGRAGSACTDARRRSPPTWSSSPPASGPATRWPGRPASTSAERGGVLVDEQCRTSDPHVWAIGECAAPGGRMYGLVAPGYAMAEVVADRAARRAGHLHRRRHVHQAQAARRRRGLVRRRVRHDRRRPRAGLRRRRSPASTRSWWSPTTADAARRRPGRRRDGVRRAAADGRQRHRAAGQPGGADPARRAAAPSTLGAARRGAGLLVQRRHQGAIRAIADGAPTCRHQGVHPGRHRPAAPASRWSRRSSRTTSSPSARSWTAASASTSG